MNMMSECWSGWSQSRRFREGEIKSEGIQFGLEMQSPYANHLLTGRKTIETRGYPLPAALLQNNDETDDEIRIDILESESGKDGVSSIPDNVTVLTSKQPKPDQASPPVLIRKGWCTFVESFKYTSREQFEADGHKHLVPRTSGYGWDDNRREYFAFVQFIYLLLHSVANNQTNQEIYGWVVGSCGYHSDNPSNANVCTDTEANVPIMTAQRRMRSLFEIQKNM